MRRAALFVAGALLLGACGSEPIVTEAWTRLRAPSAAASDAFGDDVSRDLATLRRVTAPFHDFNVASRANWAALITACMTSPAGGMGYHYGNTDLIDGAVSVDKPELLLYEPEQNGRLRLVAVE